MTMSNERWKPRRKWRSKFPYYKVQVFNHTVQSWMDEQRAFDTLEEANECIKQKFASQQARIMVVEGPGSRHVLEGEY